MSNAIPLPEPAPSHSLPDWGECALRVGNSNFTEKRQREGGYGPEPDSMLATQLHRFIYEYDDSDPYRSAWFMHRLELMLVEHAAAVTAAKDARIKVLEEQLAVAAMQLINAIGYIEEARAALGDKTPNVSS